MSEESKSFYHFMVAAKIIFGPAVDENDTAAAVTGVQGIEMNAVVLNDSEKFPVKMISRAQQAAHIQFLKRIGDEAAQSIQVHDVVILNLIPLGYMAQDEFNVLPESEQAEPEDKAAKPDLKVVKPNTFDE